ncbi:conserved hypothetical protein [Coccidioides posadasii str. Silveira]|uniref:cAMP-mediated signaling protein Sok1 n=3 Tax=Coccidioides posadasii TaxID=199306 RepID=E9D119_COCPS|nr:conserved hypothetical protein [Coccidioides posadasii str. Silveira]KMM73407.1 SOK1 protein [Coccidioides posadasii RMSCC 3488]
MDLKQKPESARRAGENEGEDTDHGDWLSGNNLGIVPKRDSGGCPTAASSAHKRHLPEGDGTLQSDIPMQYNYELSSCSSSIPALPRATAMAVSIPAHMPLDSRSLQVLRSADHLPPITKQTLSELDLDRIMRNVNLRVDVNFDRDLYFHPVEGKKGEEKGRLAKLYWEAIAIEISIYMYHARSLSGQSSNSGYQAGELQAYFEPRLPRFLETLKDVLWSLVPERDHQIITESLDVPFILQQIEKGVLDLVGLMQWLSKLVKAHCAPMRDELANKMVNQVQEGLELQDVCKTVQGLTLMFSVFECMKLDVANHQIRTFRLFLINDTVRFLQTYFQRRISENTIHTEGAKKWFHAVLKDEQASRRRWTRHWTEFDNVVTVYRGLSQFLIPFNPPGGLPATFEFHTDRLWTLRSDIQDLIGFELCTYVFDLVATSHMRHVARTRETYVSLRSHIWSIIECSGHQDPAIFDEQKWCDNVSPIALEIARIISNLEANSKGIKTSVVPDEHVLLFVERMLESCFDPRSQQFKHFQMVVQQRLEEATLAAAERYVDMSPLEMCEDQHPSQPDDSLQLQPKDIDSIGKRLAHICVLHWHIWGPILYFRDLPQTRVL